MVETLILPGLDYANILQRPNTTLSASQASSVLFPISRIADGRPSQMYIFATIAADDHIQADINQVLNAGFENWALATTPDDWTSAVTNDGAVTEHTGGHVVAGSGLQLDNGATGTAESYIDIIVMSGEAFRISVNFRTDDGAESAEVELRNLQTGNYLNTGGAWGASQVNCLEPVTTGITLATLDDVLVENFATCRSHLVTLRLRLHMDSAVANTTHNYDDVLWVPRVNFASIHGHNIDPSITVELHSDDDVAFGGLTDHGNFSVDVPTFYMAMASLTSARYWRVPVLTGTNSVPSGAFELGEAVLGQSIELLRSPSNRRLEIAEEIPQEELQSRVSGEVWRIKHSKFRQRALRLSWNQTQVIQTQFRNELLKRTNDGVDAMVIVHRDDRTDMCIHGRKARSQTFTTVGGEVDTTEMVVVESPFGIVTD